MTGATGQNVYKCGNSYSQAPCPGSVTLEVTDARTPAQKEQTDLAASRDARAADAMEIARVQQEKVNLANNTPAPPKVSKASASAAKKAPAKARKKKKTPDDFTAQAPGEKKKPAKKTKESPAATGS